MFYLSKCCVRMHTHTLWNALSIRKERERVFNRLLPLSLSIGSLVKEERHAEMEPRTRRHNTSTCQQLFFLRSYERSTNPLKMLFLMESRASDMRDKKRGVEFLLLRS